MTHMEKKILGIMKALKIQLGTGFAETLTYHMGRSSVEIQKKLVFAAGKVQAQVQVLMDKVVDLLW